MSHYFAKISKIPKCDFCKEEAKFDAKTVFGPWAYLCERCFGKYGIGLGLGLGQVLQKRDEGAK